jgi:ribosomal protein S27E
MPGVMHEEFEITLKDLRFLSMKCASCKTVVTIDMERKAEISPLDRQSTFALTKCPMCGLPFDSALTEHVNSLHAAYLGVPDRLRTGVDKRSGSS